MDDTADSWLRERQKDNLLVDGALLPGTVVGACRIVALLGRGGFAEVYRGEDADGRPVAIKILHRLDDRSRARFEQETRILLQIRHPNFPRMLSFGSCGKRPYVVMEFLRGLELPCGDRPVAEFLLTLVSAVDELHRHGYVHRDIKPANVLMRDNGEPVLIDFGQAHRIEEGRLAPRPNSLTMDASGRRTATGTAGYCAPEQLDAERTAFLPATDVYALGMLIRNFCGRMSEWRQVGSDATEPDPRRRIPNVETLRRRVLFKAAKNRLHATRDLLRDLELRRSHGRAQVHVSWERLASRHPGRGMGAQVPGLVRIMVPSMFRYVVGERLHFTGPVVVRVFGSGILELDATADRDVVFVIGGDCTVVNRSAQPSGIDYFVDNGALLCFPRIAEPERQELRRHVHLASFDGAFVHFGPETTREEINARYREAWESAVASGDSGAFARLRETRFARPDDGVPIVLRR